MPMPPDPNAPWNPSNDPMDIYGKNRAGAWPVTPLNPSQPAPNPFPATPGYWAPAYHSVKRRPWWAMPPRETSL